MIRRSLCELTPALRGAFAKRTFATGQNILSAPSLRTVEGTEISASELFANKKVVLFGVVGAFTGTCNDQHVPQYVEAADALRRELGVHDVLCVTVNDPFVGKQWAKSLGLTDDTVKLLLDSDASFARALSLDIDLSAVGLGVRSKRFSMIVDNGVVVRENVAANPGEVAETGPDALLSQKAN